MIPPETSIPEDLKDFYIERYKEHSIKLNTYVWKLSEALGKIPVGERSISIDENYIDQLLKEVLEKLK